MNLADALEKLRNLIREYEYEAPAVSEETLEKTRKRYIYIAPHGTSKFFKMLFTFSLEQIKTKSDLKIVKSIIECRQTDNSLSTIQKCHAARHIKLNIIYVCISKIKMYRIFYFFLDKKKLHECVFLKNGIVLK